MKYHTIQKLEQAKDAAYDQSVPAQLVQAVEGNDQGLSQIFGTSARKQLEAFRDMRDTRIVLASLAATAGRGEMTKSYPAFMAGKSFIRDTQALQKKNLRDVFPALKYGELLEVKQELEKAGVHFKGFNVSKFTPGKPAA
jgi:hypothetical protein